MIDYRALRGRFNHLVSDVLHAAQSYLRKDEPLYPFVITEFEMERAMLISKLGPGADDVFQVRQHVFDNREKIQIYALTYGATLTLDDESIDVIIVESGEVGKSYGHQLMKAYKKDAASGQFETSKVFNHKAIDNYLVKAP